MIRCAEPECKRNLYIGLTQRGREARFDEHISPTGYKGEENISPVYQHIIDTGHSFNIGDMEILELCCDYNKLKILESLYIKEYLLNKEILKGKDGILNRNRGKLLSLFDYTKEESETAKEYLNKVKK